jgi:phosphopantetheinyl transferase
VTVLETTRRDVPGLILHSGTDVWVLRTPRASELDPFDARAEVGSVLTRYVQNGVLRVRRDHRGRPYLEEADGLRFSLARSAGVTLVAVSSEAEVGVDIERRVDRGLTSLPAHALTDTELDTLGRFPEAARADAFLTYWVRKEAILKAAGVGLGVEPSLLEVSGPREDPVVKAVPDTLDPTSVWTLVDLALPGYAAAVAVRRPASEVRLIERRACA